MKLTSVEETMLIPLWARAYETTRAGERLIEDKVAVKLISEIDYDFTKFAKAKMSQNGVAVRSAILDREVKNFIAAHANVICINLACGLDTRFQRIDNGKLKWYNIDLEAVMELRKKLIPSANEGEYNLAASIFDKEWPLKIEHKDEDVLFIMEGASMYFTRKEMEGFFAQLANNFSGSFFLMEVMTPFIIKQQKHHDAVDTKKAPFKWGVTEGKEIEALHTQIQFLKQWTFYEGYRKRWGIMGLLSLIPWWNKNCNDKIVYLKIRK